MHIILLLCVGDYGTLMNVPGPPYINCVIELLCVVWYSLWRQCLSRSLTPTCCNILVTTLINTKDKIDSHILVLDYSYRCSVFIYHTGSSLGAHCTSQLSPSCVWRTRNPTAGYLHMVERSFILISSTSRDRLRVLINTFICATRV